MFFPVTSQLHILLVYLVVFSLPPLSLVLSHKAGSCFHLSYTLAVQFLLGLPHIPLLLPSCPDLLKVTSVTDSVSCYSGLFGSY